MARDTGSVWAPLPEAGAPDGMTKDKFIVHSTGDNGTAAATRRYFELAGTVTESTFIIGWGPERNDPTLQIMDSTDIADANVGANRSGISVEVVGDGKSGYTPWQRSEMIRLGSWAHRIHPIPLRVCPSATAGGYGWHVMFGAPGPWAAVAKSCPGGPRIKELQADIFPAIFSGTSPSTEEFTVSQYDDIMAAITQVRNEAWQQHKDMANYIGTLNKSVTDILVGGNTGGHNNFNYLDDKIAAVAQMVASAPGVQVDETALQAAVARSVQAAQPVDVKALASAFADEADRRARDGDPGTGPAS